jgi:hypothetical protein
MPGYGLVQQWFCLVRISTRSQAAVIVLFHELGSPINPAFLAASIARTVPWPRSAPGSPAPGQQTTLSIARDGQHLEAERHGVPAASI